MKSSIILEKGSQLKLSIWRATIAHLRAQLTLASYTQAT